jgi:hypothetical protein
MKMQKVVMLQGSTNPFRIFRALLAGSSVEELQADVLKLSAVEHNTLVCTLCSLEKEIATNCQQRGEEVQRFIQDNCSFYRAGAQACPRSSIAGIEGFRDKAGL